AERLVRRPCTSVRLAGRSRVDRGPNRDARWSSKTVVQIRGDLVLRWPPIEPPVLLLCRSPYSLGRAKLPLRVDGARRTQGFEALHGSHAPARFATSCDSRSSKARITRRLASPKK